MTNEAAVDGKDLPVVGDLKLKEAKSHRRNGKEDLLVIKNLVKYYPIRGGLLQRVQAWVKAVDDVSFSIKSGETLGLVGESGCGKTTVGRTILGLIPHNSGSVHFGGQDVLEAFASKKERDIQQMTRRAAITATPFLLFALDMIPIYLVAIFMTFIYALGMGWQGIIATNRKQTMKDFVRQNAIPWAVGVFGGAVWFWITVALFDGDATLAKSIMGILLVTGIAVGVPLLLGGLLLDAFLIGVSITFIILVFFLGALFSGGSTIVSLALLLVVLAADVGLTVATSLGWRSLVEQYKPEKTDEFVRQSTRAWWASLVMAIVLYVVWLVLFAVPGKVVLPVLLLWFIVVCVQAYFGRIIAQRAKVLRRDMQIVFQDPYSSLDPRMPIGDSIGEGLLVHGSGNSRERWHTVLKTMDLVGLKEFHARRYPHEFSGGQRQRIGIARALALQPKFIVCDEPVSALDVSVQAQVLNILMDLQAELGLTYLFIAHNLSVVEHISDRVAVMYLGKMVELTDREQLFSNPLHPYTQALMSAIPVPDPNLKRERMILKGDVPSPINPPSGCRFHPRCPVVMDRCSQEAPEFKDIGDGHFVACWRVE